MADDGTSTDDSTGTEGDTSAGGQGTQPQGTEGGQPDSGSTGTQDGQPDKGGDQGDGGTDWKAEARKHEGRSKENKTAAAKAQQERDQLAATLASLRKALDPNAKDDDDPTKAAENAVSERDKAIGELRAERLERAAERAARKAEVDPDALLDSRGFVTALAKLDPTDSSFGDDLTAAINAAVGANPRLKVTPPPPPASATADMKGGGGQGPASGSIEAMREQRRKRRAE